MPITVPVIVRDYDETQGTYVTWLLFPQAWSLKEARQAFCTRYGRNPADVTRINKHVHAPSYVRVGPVFTDDTPPLRMTFDHRPQSACQ
jgi:hypothetical protein